MRKILRFCDVVSLPYSKNAIIRDDFPGFKEDYLALHCIIRKYKPRRFIEIGTSTGSGTNVICRAIGIHRKWINFKKVFSIDVPPGTNPDIIYPDHEDGHPK
jgi:predicted O-methyltransferase YrrM